MAPLTLHSPEQIADELNLGAGVKDQLKKINDDTLHIHERIAAAMDAKRAVDTFIKGTLDGIKAAEDWLTNMHGILTGLGKTPAEIDTMMRDVRAKNADTLQLRFDALMSLRQHIVALEGAAPKPGDHLSKYRSTEQAKTTVKGFLTASGRYTDAEAVIVMKHLEAQHAFDVIRPGAVAPDPSTVHAMAMQAEIAVHGDAAVAAGNLKNDSAPGAGILSAQLAVAINLIPAIAVIPPTDYDRHMMPALAKRAPDDIAPVQADVRNVARVSPKASVGVRTSTGNEYYMYFDADEEASIHPDLLTDAAAGGRVMEVNYVTNDDMLNLLEEMDHGDTLNAMLRTDVEGIPAGTPIILEGKSDSADFELVAIAGAAPADLALAGRARDAIKAAPMQHLSRGYTVNWATI